MAPKKKPSVEGLGLFADRPGALIGVNREPPNLITMYLDRSGSQGPAWPETLGGTRSVIDRGKDHRAVRSTTRVSVALCGPEVLASPYTPFADASVPDVPLVAGSPGGLWVQHMVAGLRAEVARLREAGVVVNKVIALLLTDFHFEDPTRFHEAVEQYRALENEWPNFTGLPVMTGPNPNQELAARLSRKVQPVRLDDAKVRDLFDWLFASVVRASQSRTGEAVALPPRDWILSDAPRS